MALELLKLFRKRTPQEALTYLELAKGFDFEGKPFTRACVALGSHLRDKTRADAQVMFGGHRLPSPAEITLDQLVLSCTETVAKHVADRAAEANGIDHIFFPFKKAAGTSFQLLAFALIIALALRVQIEKENVTIEAEKLNSSLLLSFFIGWEAEDAKPIITDGAALYEQLIEADRQDLQDWVENLMNLSIGYVQQWVSEDANYKKLDIVGSLGKLLKSLLAISRGQQGGFVG